MDKWFVSMKISMTNLTTITTSRSPCIQKVDVPWSALIVTFNIKNLGIWLNYENED